MKILEGATDGELFRLLQLFPASTLKEQWGTVRLHLKEAICHAAAKERDIKKITKFVQQNFSQCRMHVNVLSPNPPTDPVSALTESQIVAKSMSGMKLLIVRVTYIVILQDSLQRQKVNLLWPMRYGVVEDHPVLTTIVLERNPGKLFDESVSIVSRSIDDKTIEKNLRALNIHSADLHKGMKALWAADYMDAFRVKFLSPDSLVDETMKEEKGIKATKPARYEELLKAKMFMSYFRLLDRSVSSIGDFTIDPSKGLIRFPRYIEDAGNADEVVRSLLAKN